MYRVRPARHDDVPGIERLLSQMEARVSTLPEDRDRLAEKIELSQRAFERDPLVAGRERLLFVLEETESGDILGTSGIDRSAGNGTPFYNYRCDELIHSSHQLDVNNTVPVLYMTHELTGRSLLCSLTFDKNRVDQAGRELLSRARFLYMHLNADRFDPRVIVEIQGVQTPDGQSPFWDSLGRHFFGMDFREADYYSHVKSKTFIAELMPAHPIYVTLLSEYAQEVIGQPHPAAEANCQLLHREGFRIGKYIDIFDGGPTLEAELAQINTVKRAKLKQVKRAPHTMGLNYLVGVARENSFVATLAKLTDGMGDVLRVPETCADTLNVSDGDDVVLSPL
ncbi:MAG: arginine N-succinyltransferase [Gammaproteobacteria bacterium]|nr:MAG: arginine N-succinyltransferase [Gammaproteobacteria bacterium]